METRQIMRQFSPEALIICSAANSKTNLMMSRRAMMKDPKAIVPR
jgi:hypothetical protein